MNRAEKYAVAVDHVKANVWKCEKCGDLIPNLYKSCPYCMYDDKDHKCRHGVPYLSDSGETEPCPKCDLPQEDDMVNAPKHYKLPGGIEVDDSYLSGLLLQRFYLDKEIKRIGENK